LPEEVGKSVITPPLNPSRLKAKNLEHRKERGCHKTRPEIPRPPRNKTPGGEKIQRSVPVFSQKGQGRAKVDVHKGKRGQRKAKKKKKKKFETR